MSCTSLGGWLLLHFVALDVVGAGRRASCTSLGGRLLGATLNSAPFVDAAAHFLDLVIDSDWRLSLWLCATESGVGAPRCTCGGSLRRFKALLVDLVPF